MFIIFVGGVLSHQSNTREVWACPNLSFENGPVPCTLKYLIYTQRKLLLVVCHVSETRVLQSMESRQECEKIVCCSVVESTEAERYR